MHNNISFNKMEKILTVIKYIFLCLYWRETCDWSSYKTIINFFLFIYIYTNYYKLKFF